jgi:hypothetical protein
MFKNTFIVLVVAALLIVLVVAGPCWSYGHGTHCLGLCMLYPTQFGRGWPC